MEPRDDADDFDLQFVAAARTMIGLETSPLQAVDFGCSNKSYAQFFRCSRIADWRISLADPAAYPIAPVALVVRRCKNDITVKQVGL